MNALSHDGNQVLKVNEGAAQIRRTEIAESDPQSITRQAGGGSRTAASRDLRRPQGMNFV
jgi:hypothetical protein